MKSLLAVLALVPFAFAQDSQPADRYGPPQLAAVSVEAKVTAGGGIGAFRVSYVLERVASDPSGRRDTLPVGSRTFDLTGEHGAIVDQIRDAIARDWETHQRVGVQQRQLRQQRP